MGRLDTAARRGKLPGFSSGAGIGGETTFTISDFGSPFESLVACRTLQADLGSRVEIGSPRLKPLLPWVFGLILGLSVWPGSWLTDSMLRSYSDWYGAQAWWITYAWYLPLTVPFCPMAMLSAVRKSRAAAAAEVGGLVERVAAAVNGRRADAA